MKKRGARPLSPWALRARSAAAPDETVIEVGEHVIACAHVDPKDVYQVPRDGSNVHRHSATGRVFKATWVLLCDECQGRLLGGAPIDTMLTRDFDLTERVVVRHRAGPPAVLS